MKRCPDAVSVTNQSKDAEYELDLGWRYTGFWNDHVLYTAILYNAGRSQTAFHGEITKKTNKNSPSLLAEQVCTYIETNKEKQP